MKKRELKVEKKGFSFDMTPSGVVRWCWVWLGVLGEKAQSWDFSRQRLGGDAPFVAHSVARQMGNLALVAARAG